MSDFPFTPEKVGNFCSECCTKHPTSWVLSEGASEYYDGLVYGNGGLTRSPNPNPEDYYSYDGMSSGFTSEYCYTGFMTIYITCDDGRRVLTHSFSSVCGTTQLLPQSVINPCCPS
jgi:hypothetical protein